MVWSKLSPVYTWHRFLRLRDTSVGAMMRQMLINGDYVELWCASPGTDVTCVHRSQSSQQHRFSSCRHCRIRLMFPWFAVLYWYVIIQRYIILWTESMVRWTKNGQIKMGYVCYYYYLKDTKFYAVTEWFSPETCALSRLTGVVGFHSVSVPGCW